MEYLSEILAFLFGVLGGWNLKIILGKKVTQKNISAGGDVVGGDKRI